MKAIEAIGIAVFVAAAAAPCSAGEVHGRSDAGRDSYSIVVHDTWMSSNQSVPQMESMLARFQGDYVWLRRHGKVYVVRDAARMEEARQIFQAPDPERDSLERERSAFERRESELDREQDRLEEASDEMRDADDDEDGPKLDEAALRRLEEVKAKRREVHSQMRELEAQDRELDRREDAIEKRDEVRLWALADRWIADGTAQSTPER
jgi:flagellar biosynthesis GTPase FlhF